MAAAVTRRRRARRAGYMEIGGWDEALEELARTLGDGCIALIHQKTCPLANGGEACTCPAIIVGPAVRTLQ